MRLPSVLTQTTATLFLCTVLQQGRHANNQFIFKSRFRVLAGLLSMGKAGGNVVNWLHNNAESDMTKVRDFREKNLRPSLNARKNLKPSNK